MENLAQEQLPIEEPKDQQISRKQRILESRGKKVALDLFLYSCLEQERLFSAKTSNQQQRIQWPFLSDETAADLNKITEAKDFEELKSDLFKWYKDHCPQLTTIHLIDRENMHEVIEPLVSIHHDLVTLYRKKHEKSLPEYHKGMKDDGFWQKLEQDLSNVFPQTYEYMVRYLQWSYASEPVDDFEIGDVPPVGRWAPRFGSRDREERGTSSRQSTRAPQSREKRPARGTNKRGEAPVKPSWKAREEREEKRTMSPNRGQRKPQDTDPQLKAAALSEVEQAIEKLLAEPDLIKITLRPNNSFYRRLQHQAIVDAGYLSFSTGEGSERAVTISRKDPS